MTSPVDLASLPSNLPKVWAGVGSLVAVVASFTLPFWPWLASLGSTGFLLWLRYYMAGLEKDRQRAHEAKKWQHDATEREIDRQHEAKKWKHDKEIARINAPARSTSSSSVMVAA